jgi:hypothetical protein
MFNQNSKQYEVIVEPGVYREGRCVDVSTGDRYVVRIWAHDMTRAMEQAVAQAGGPDRARAGTTRQVY